MDQRLFTVSRRVEDEPIGLSSTTQPLDLYVRDEKPICLSFLHTPSGCFYLKYPLPSSCLERLSFDLLRRELSPVYFGCVVSLPDSFTPFPIYLFTLL